MTVLQNGFTQNVNLYLTQLNEITSCINLLNFGEAKNKFSNFLKQVKGIGAYNSINWPEEFTKKVYATAILISENCPDLLGIVTKEISSSLDNEKEILYFIESEIIINIHGASTSNIAYIENLIQRYPINAEFVHDLGTVEFMNNNLLAAVNYYLIAIKLNPLNNSFLQNCFNAETNYIENLINQENFEEATNHVNNILTIRKTYTNEYVYNNWFLAIQSRIKDHILIRSTLIKKEADIESRLSIRFDKERFKAIEMIGVFTAIIAFIFSTISIATKYPFNEALLLEMTFGLVLILFTVVISLILSPKEKGIFKDIRFYSGLLILTALICTYWLNKIS